MISGVGGFGARTREQPLATVFSLSIDAAPQGSAS